MGHPDLEYDNVREIVGCKEHEIVNVTSGNATPTIQNCRFVWVDVAGIIKFDYKSKNGSVTKTMVRSLVQGVNQFTDVSSVYRYYKDTTACTAQVYDDSGNLVTGICLCR